MFLRYIIFDPGLLRKYHFASFGQGCITVLLLGPVENGGITQPLMHLHCLALGYQQVAPVFPSTHTRKYLIHAFVCHLQYRQKMS